MAVNTERLTYRQITESDNWSAVVDKINYNFDQTKAYGGGDKGDRGYMGIRGLPGATGIGKQGLPGPKGATITFSSTAITSGQAADPSLKEGDVVIDSTSGNFYNVIKNNIGNLVYNFQYSIASAIAGSIVETENQVAAQGTNPITKFYLRTGTPGIGNALFVDRIIGTTTDDGQMYRVVIGDTAGPTLQNNALTLINILPDATTASAKNQLFSQLAFKYRPSPVSYPTSNTGYLQYLELNKNETTPAGTDDTYMLMTNIATGFGLFNDNSLGASNSYAMIRGKNVRFMGTTALNALYVNGAINNANPYIDIIVDNNVNASWLKSSSTFVLQSLGGNIGIYSTDYVAVQAGRTFINSLYVGAANFSSASTFVPANGIVAQGAVWAGFSGAANTPSTVNTMLAVNGDIDMKGSVISVGAGTDGNLQTIWNDDRNDIAGIGGIWHFTSDAGYKVSGNAGGQFGRLFSERLDVTGQLIIGPWTIPAGSGWTAGNTFGLSVYGKSTLNDNVTMAGTLAVAATTTINGALYANGSIFTPVGQTTFIADGLTSYIGSNQGASVWRYFNQSLGNYDWLGYHNTYHDWMLTLNGGGPFKIIHEGNLDAIVGVNYVRHGVRSDGDYVWIRNTNATLAFGVTQHTTNAIIQGWYAGAGDGTEKAHIGYNGTFYTVGDITAVGQMYATDFNITSDEKLKKNIKPIKTAIEIVKKLNPVTFNWAANKALHSGLIAQEVQAILPHVVSKNAEIDALTLSTTEIVPYLVKALQETMDEVAELKKMVQQLLKK